MTRAGDEVGSDVGHDVFEQGPIMPRGIPVFLCIWLGFALVAPAFIDQDLNLRWVLMSIAMIAILGVVIVLATMWEWKKSVRVDGRGLHVKGQLALRPRQMGFVEALRGGTRGDVVVAAVASSWPGTTEAPGTPEPVRGSVWAGSGRGRGGSVGGGSDDLADPVA
jgi:hypothetical protein